MFGNSSSHEREKTVSWGLKHNILISDQSKDLPGFFFKGHFGSEHIRFFLKDFLIPRRDTESVRSFCGFVPQQRLGGSLLFSCSRQ